MQVPVAARGERRLDGRDVALDRREDARDAAEPVEDLSELRGELAGCDIRPGEHARVDPPRPASLLPSHHWFLVAPHQAALFGARAVRAQQREAALGIPGDHQAAALGLEAPGAAVATSAELEGVLLREERMLLKVARQLLADGAALAKTGLGAVARGVHVRVDVGACHDNGRTRGRIRRQILEGTARRCQPVRQALRKRVRRHPAGYECSQGGVHRSLRTPYAPFFAQLLVSRPGGIGLSSSRSGFEVFAPRLRRARPPAGCAGAPRRRETPSGASCSRN